MCLIGIGVAVGTMIAAGAFILYPQILKSAPTPDFPPARNAEEANRQDIEHLGRLVEIDRSFTPDAKRKFLAGIEELAGRAASLTAADLEMQASRLVALADNGHTNIRGVGHGVTLNSLPIRIGRFEEGYFVVRARPAFEDLLGARIVAINGRPPEALAEALAPFVGGPPPLRREFATYTMVSPRALKAAGLSGVDDHATLTVKSPGSAVETTIEIPADPDPANGPARDDPLLEAARRGHWPQRDLSPIASPTDVGDWRTVLDPEEALPRFLSDPDRRYWSEEIPEIRSIYVQLNRVRDNDDGPTLPLFLQGVVDGIRGNGTRHAIVDLRFNPGGDYTRTATFTKSLPEALPPDGRLFILTSGNTFSAAIVTAARLKHFAGDRATIVGEPMGDRGRFWGEGGNFVLPNSGLQVGYATSAHDWENGCDLSEIRTCYFVNYFLGVRAGPLAPNLSVSPRFSDYAEGRDTLLEAVSEELAREN